MPLFRRLFPVLLAFTPALHAQSTIPYQWHSVVIRGGGFVSGLVYSHAKKGLVYARTDVGGAYRSTNAGEQWVPITDHLGRADVNLTGIESIALDPSNPDVVYLAAGTYSQDWAGPSAILRSADAGRTFTRSALPFKLGGNEDGRQTGERLAVDPAHPATLFYGSRKAGLWRSDDSAATWKRVDSFPAAFPLTGIGAGTGFTFVTFAAGALYAGLAQPGASLYRSLDSGLTWQLVPGLPSNTKDLFATRGVPAGTSLLLNFNNAPGPNGITDGAVVRLDPDGKSHEITPLRPNTEGVGHFGYGGLTVDAEHPETLMVTTIDRWYPADTIFRSTDGGRHWKDLGPNAVYTAPAAPWTYGHSQKTGGTGWMASIEIDPFDSARVMYSTGAGIWGSADVTAADAGKPTHWGFPNENLEETVPLALISPSAGAHLVSGLGDIDGLRHDTLDSSPAGGLFADPHYSNTESMDFAGTQPLTLVRTGTGDKVVHIALSTDGGSIWHALANEPPGSRGAGHAAISADGATIVWTPRDGDAWFTDNLGRSWNRCAGLPPRLRVLSDRVDPAKFYSFSAATGQLYESLDKARTFALRTEPVAKPADHALLAATPGLDGDLWIAAAGVLFHSADSGVTFTATPAVDAVDALGFGKAAPGAPYPALYLAGSVGGHAGLFRSTDKGQTWFRIDDPTHQFGESRLILGDPRIFGRVYLGTGGRGILYGDPTPPGAP